MTQSAVDQTPGLEHANDLAEFDLRQRWERRPPNDFPCPHATGWGFDRYGLWQAFTVKDVTVRMRYIPPGKFLMGSPEDEPERGSDEQQHPVTLTQGFWLGETTVTQALWQAVMGDNPSRFKARESDEAGLNRPVEQVSWDDGHGFFEQLNAQRPGEHWTFPTEAQWEYACRAGTTTPFSMGDQLTTDQANYDGNYPYAEGAKGKYREQTVTVKTVAPNGWGLYEMHGNVWEWCLDERRDYTAEAVQDPMGSLDGPGRALRGGGWDDFGRRCRSAYRDARECVDRRDSIGVRVARVSRPPR